MDVDHQAIRDGLGAALIAGATSGAPSTIHALLTGRDPLEAARAAGTILLPSEDRSDRLLAAAVPVHGLISIAWSVALAATLPHRRTVCYGALAGALIAAVDLGAAARWWPRIRALPQGAQLADHVAFGAIAGYVVARRRAARELADGRSKT